MLGNKVIDMRLIVHEIRRNVLGLLLLALVSIVFMTLGVSMGYFKSSMPKHMTDYLNEMSGDVIYEVEIFWMSESEVHFVEKLAAEYAGVVVETNGEENHHELKINMTGYYRTDEFLSILEKESISAYSEQKDVVSSIYEDVMFSQSLFRTLEGLLMLAFFCCIYAGINMILKSRRKFVYMLLTLGFGYIKIVVDYAIIFVGTLVTVLPMVGVLSHWYIRYTQNKLMEIYGMSQMTPQFKYYMGDMLIALLCSVVLICMVISLYFCRTRKILIEWGRGGQR